ncbi:MAG TPA: type I restriction-modification enzyme R subunit C-terminal domain-containing protein [Acidimicrobiales bacterium]|nr:type I restriction-modification enzyme R subunit C-terminal domain-containing protein [Acidimicrobiales bacterium]
MTWGANRPELSGVDEARAAPERDLSALARALQTVVARRLQPVAVVFSALPTFRERLAGAGTYASRLPVEEVGSLDATAARLALVGPAARRHVAWEDEALELLVRRSAGHPYYLQLFGWHAWEAAQGEATINHQDHIAIHRLRMSKPLTPRDLGALESMLAENGIVDAATIARAKEESQGLGLFVRSLIGLDRGAAKEGFADFLEARTLTGNQIEFIDLIINHLTEHGVMGAALLYESPFTDIAPHGPDDLFTSDEVETDFWRFWITSAPRRRPPKSDFVLGPAVVASSKLGHMALRRHSTPVTTPQLDGRCRLDQGNGRMLHRKW